MSNSPTTPHIAVEICNPAVVETTDTTVISNHKRLLRQKHANSSLPTMQGIISVPNRSNSGIFNKNFLHRSISHRQRAEIQLQSLLNESEESLPAFVRRAAENIRKENLTIEEVSKLLNTPIFIIERLIRVLYSSTRTTNDRQTVSKLEAQRLTHALNSTIEVRALIFFMMLDEAGDDYVTSNGLIEFYETYFKDYKAFDRNRLQEVIQLLRQKFHLDQKPQIDFEDFYSIVSKDPTLLECLSQFTVNPIWLTKSSLKTPRKKSRIRQFFSKHCFNREDYENCKEKLSISYMKDNLSRVILLLIYILTNLGLLLYVAIYRASILKDHAFVVFARIAGMLLNFNCAFVIVLMLKHIILLIRTNTVLRKLLPVDDHIDFHKFVGRFIAVLSVIHTIAHMANFGRLKAYSWWTYMFTTKPGIGWVAGFAPLSGVILCIILAVIVICSMQWIRRGGHFQIFYWTHLLYLLFYVFLILHAKFFWKWAIGPLSFFLAEKIYSVLQRISASSGRTDIHSATIEQSNVISLTIRRPKRFNFQPGDYISINIPSVALYEFHPFTISSAPEEADLIRVHIQAVGNWTKQVYQRFKDISEQETHENKLQIYRADLRPQESSFNRQRSEGINAAVTEADTKSKKSELIFIKGPYSSCARYVFDCKHIVLIGGGIGITPYASILSSLMAQFRASCITCKHCHQTNYLTKGLDGNRQLQKVDFIWVNRDYKSFEWFLNLLREFEEEQENYLELNPDEKRFLDIHLYFTEIKNEENIGNVPLEFVTKIWAQVAGQDIFTSLKSKTHLGRPEWESLFNRIASSENPVTDDDVNVFFCGPSTMARTIQKHCSTFRFRFYEEKF